MEVEQRILEDLEKSKSRLRMAESRIVKERREEEEYGSEYEYYTEGYNRS